MFSCSCSVPTLTGEIIKLPPRKELLEEHQKRDMKALSALHDHASLQLEKTHKIEEFNCKMNIMRENNEQVWPQVVEMKNNKLLLLRVYSYC